MHNNIHTLPRLGLSAAMRVYGFTARALRFYEERGLVEARRDRLNTRYYDAPARERLAWIARLRKADIALQAIADVLDAPPEARPAVALDKVRARRGVVAAQLDALDAALAELQLGAPVASPVTRPAAV